MVFPKGRIALVDEAKQQIVVTEDDGTERRYDIDPQICQLSVIGGFLTDRVMFTLIGKRSHRINDALPADCEC